MQISGSKWTYGCEESTLSAVRPSGGGVVTPYAAQARTSSLRSAGRSNARVGSEDASSSSVPRTAAVAVGVISAHHHAVSCGRGTGRNEMITINRDEAGAAGAAGRRPRIPAQAGNIPPGRAHGHQYRGSAWYLNSASVNGCLHVANSSA